MSRAKRASKRRSRAKAVTVLGVAGALSLMGSASGAAVGPQGDTLTAGTAITLDEEEISDVSLSTFYVFDHENAGVRVPAHNLPRGHADRGKVAEAAQETAEVEAPHAAQAAEERMVCRKQWGRPKRRQSFASARNTGAACLSKPG